VTSIRHTISVVAVLVSTTACSNFQEFLSPQAASNEPASETTVVPVIAEPISRNYFVLDDPQQTVIGELQVVHTTADDTFSDLAREYGLGYDEIAAANPNIDPWLPGENTAVLLPTQYILPNVARVGVVLNIAAKRLYYFPPVVAGQSAVVMTYPIGIGRVGWETPLGQTEVVAKAKDPAWYVPASVRKEHAEKGDPLPAIVGAGPDNPLGEYVLKLGIPGYLIHGTNQPYGVGMRVSHGCVRLYPENIELLYSLVGIGVPVALVNQPYLAGQRGGELYFEAHSPLEEDAANASADLQTVFAANDGFQSIATRNTARSLADNAEGISTQLTNAGAVDDAGQIRWVRNTVVHDPDEPTLDEVRALLDAEDDEAVDEYSSISDATTTQDPR
jgi:L,D-transpeptidase ErfK/SrfK